MDEYKKNREKEVDSNYAAFQKLLPTIIADHRNEYALMKGGKIMDYFTTQKDARKAGELSFKDKIFSIQQVTDTKIDLGYYSCYAVV